MKNILKMLLSILVIIVLIIFSVAIGNDKETKNISYSASSNNSDLQLMARAINGEARGEPYEGQVAVGAVILNRVKSSQFPPEFATF